MIQVTFAVSIVVAYLAFEQSEENDKLMRAMSVSLVSEIISQTSCTLRNFLLRHINDSNGLISAFLFTPLVIKL